MSGVARLVMPALRWRRATGFDHERSKIDACLRAGVGGFILFGGTVDVVRRLNRDLVQQAGRPLLLAGDFERGPGQQVQGLTEMPPPLALGAVDDTAATRRAAEITALELRSVGFNWAFAPVADLDLEPENPIVQTRSFGADSTRVAGHVAAWIDGCQRAGVLATAKHYPGHGRTTQDSHETLPVLNTTLAELERTDLLPFRVAVRAGVASVMAGFVAFPNWDASGAAASLSAPILRYLRDPLGFDGLVVTDAFIMAGATARQAATEAAVTAIATGCDVLLYPDDPLGTVSALERAAGGTIPSARIDDALARYERTLGRIATGPANSTEQREHARFADHLADRAVRMVRGMPPSLRSPVEVSIVDDDVGGPYAVGPRNVITQELVARGAVRTPGTKVLLVYSEPRSWKGRASFGERSMIALAREAPSAAVVVLFGHPRLAPLIPGNAPVVCCWHGQALMQRAAARWVVNRLT
jgi:beta-glucosidase-like glycosyl hydrolase